MLIQNSLRRTEMLNAQKCKKVTLIPKSSDFETLHRINVNKKHGSINVLIFKQRHSSSQREKPLMVKKKRIGRKDNMETSSSSTVWMR
jgi:hypothetical protein